MLNNQMQCSGGMSCGRLVCLFLIPGILIAALFATVGLIVGAVAAEAIFFKSCRVHCACRSAGTYADNLDNLSRLSLQKAVNSRHL